MARETDISLGTGVVSKEQSILDILDKDRVRKVEFDKLCVNCKVDSNEDRVELVNNGGASGEDAPCTPDAQIIRSQMGEASDKMGQQTYVGKKKKLKHIVTP
jgi:hypothetical protein